MYGSFPSSRCRLAVGRHHRSRLGSGVRASGLAIALPEYSSGLAAGQRWRWLVGEGSREPVGGGGGGGVTSMFPAKPG